MLKLIMLLRILNNNLMINGTMFDNALKTFIKNDDNSSKGKEESKQKEVKHKLNIDMFEKNSKKNETQPLTNKPANSQKETTEAPKTMSMAERMKLFESKASSNANNQTKPPVTFGTTKKVAMFEKQESPIKPEIKKEIPKNKTNLIEERLNNLNKPKEVEKPKEVVNEPSKVAPSFADRMKFLQNNANVIQNQNKPPINIGHTNKVAMFEKPQSNPSEPKKEEPVKMGSFEERQQQMRMRLMTMPMGMMKRPELKKEETEQEDSKKEVASHKAVENIQNKPVRKIRRKTMAPKFNFDGK